MCGSTIILLIQPIRSVFSGAVVTVTVATARYYEPQATSQVLPDDKKVSQLVFRLSAENWDFDSYSYYSLRDKYSYIKRYDHPPKYG